MLRHIAPEASGGSPGIIDPQGTGYAVLARTLYADPLPTSRLPTSPDFHEGKYTLRMLDSGDWEIGFPNKDASDGLPWRDRFSPDGHLEWIEISREGEIEFIGVIVKPVKSRQKITISGYDGFWLLKKAFEQEYTAVIAPRDLIERYSCLWVLRLADTFPGEALDTKWSQAVSGGAVTVSQPYGVVLTSGSTSGLHAAEIRSTTSFSIEEGQSFELYATVTLRSNAPGGEAAAGQLAFGLAHEAGAEMSEYLLIGLETAYLHSPGTVKEFPIPGRNPSVATTFALALRGDGRWLSAYVNGLLIGIVKQETDVTRVVALYCDRGAEVTCKHLVFRTLSPFLMRGSEKGDYVLPGTADTYPTGGLHGRYVVQGAEEAGWYHTILAPDPRRTGFPEYIQNEQETIDNNIQANGVPETFYAARFFGAIYLKLSQGNYQIRVGIGTHVGFRLWIGKTQFGQQLLDKWAVNEGAVAYEVTLNAASLGGKDGWYPIILEFFRTEPNANGSIDLYFTPSGSYTDPGGGALTATNTLVPATSLSPLGCVDTRIQGTSFFDLVQETAKNFGYQLACEPRQLESGEFPGQLIPKARIGRDTDEIVEVDDLDRKSGINEYTQTLDATDSATSVKAFGSGIADGKGSQIAFEAISIPDEETALFDIQAWCSASDIAFPALLAARAEAELALRLGAWENVEGEPIARDRLADTFPLTGILSQFRWHVGDGVRLWLPDVGIEDTVPRPIFQVARSFTAEGRTGTHIGFRARPKDALYAVRTALREATRPARAYQKQYTTRTSQHIQATAVGAGAYTPYAILALTPNDRVIDAKVVISLNGSSQTTGIEVNTVDRTEALGGPWRTPATVNIISCATPNNSLTDQRLFIRLHNTSGAENTEIDFQVILTLLI
jgi:hypothetical protein